MKKLLIIIALLLTTNAYAERSNFRGLEIGLSNQQLTEVLEQQKENYAIMTAVQNTAGGYQGEPVNWYELSLTLIPAEVANDEYEFWYYDRSEFAEIYIREHEDIDHEKIYEENSELAVHHAENRERIGGTLDRYVGTLKWPKFTVRALKLQPSFFNAESMNVSEFMDALLSNYDFYDPGFMLASELGLKCECVAGILITGELVALTTTSNYDWEMIVRNASDEEIGRVTKSTQPTFN